MNSSVKFLSPSVTGGLPVPGPLFVESAVVAIVEVLAGAELVLLLLELLDELPHAASSIGKATARTLASALLRELICMFLLVDDIEVQTVSPTAGTRATAAPAPSAPTFKPCGVASRW